jgi:hypothetical protein
MNYRLFAAAACAALLAAGCANKQEQTSAPAGGASPATTLTNTTGLPLIADAVIIDTRDFHQMLDPTQQAGNPLASMGKGTYVGHEVVASSLTGDADLAKWLASVAASPPEGWKKSDPGGESVHAEARKYGVDYVAFVSGTNKGATIIVMDPKLVTTKLGPVLALLDRYNSMPLPMRQGIDAQVKQRTGMSISEMTDKSSPLGAAIGAVNEFKSSDKRAIILVSGEKQQ